MFQEYFYKRNMPSHLHGLDNFLFDFREDIKDLHQVTQGDNIAALALLLEELHCLKKELLTLCQKVLHLILDNDEERTYLKANLINSLKTALNNIKKSQIAISTCWSRAMRQ